MLIIYRRNIIFYAIYKNAHNSLMKTFKIFGDRVKTENWMLERIRPEDYFKFTFVRNPFDRLVSTYLNQVKQPTEFSKGYFDDGIYEGYKELGFDPEMSFKEFVNKVCAIPDNESNPHFRSQHTFIGEVDFIGKIENLREDLDKISEKLRLEIPNPPEINKTKERKHYREYYDQETRSLVEKRYKEDLKRFGYEFKQKV